LAYYRVGGADEHDDKRQPCDKLANSGIDGVNNAGDGQEEFHVTRIRQGVKNCKTGCILADPRRSYSWYMPAVRTPARPRQDEFAAPARHRSPGADTLRDTGPPPNTGQPG